MFCFTLWICHWKHVCFFFLENCFKLKEIFNVCRLCFSLMVLWLKPKWIDLVFKKMNIYPRRQKSFQQSLNSLERVSSPIPWGSLHLLIMRTAIQGTELWDTSVTYFVMCEIKKKKTFLDWQQLLCIWKFTAHIYYFFPFPHIPASIHQTQLLQSQVFSMCSCQCQVEFKSNGNRCSSARKISMFALLLPSADKCKRERL